VLQYFFK